MATKKKSKKSAPKKAAVRNKIARQKTIPGMEDSKINAIETAALDYAEVRDQRVGLSAQESSLKKELLTLMHKEGKTEYKRNGIHVTVITEKENVKVRVKSGDDAEEETGEDVKAEIAEAVGA